VRTDPFLRRIGLLVFASTAAAVMVDYLFKLTLAQTTARQDVAPLLARFYVVLNVLPIVVQLLVSGPLVQRIGLARSLAVTPLLMLVGSAGALLVGVGLGPVLVLRGLDGTLRNSVHRMTTELAYLPVPAAARARAKPFLDGVLPRVTQGVLGTVLVAAGAKSVLSESGLAAVAATMISVWLLLAITTYRPYLDLLRRAIASGRPLDVGHDLAPLDFDTAETLVQQLASLDAVQVQGAMNVLTRRKRGRLIPALVLLHEAEDVLVRALHIFSSSQREDWVPRARRMTADPREGVRAAAVKALAAARRLRPEDLARDASARVRGHAVLCLALTHNVPDIVADDTIREILAMEDATGDDARFGLLDAMGTIGRDERLLPLACILATRAGTSRAWNEALASAASTQQAADMIPFLVARIRFRDGRDAVRVALVSLGPPAFDAVSEAMMASNAGRTLRLHLPDTLARFGTKPAAALLQRVIDEDTDGLVRYKAIRALGRLVAATGMRVDRVRAEQLAHRNLLEHFRLVGLRTQFDDVDLSSAAPEPRELTARLLLGLLDDKLRQSLERTFRLLKIAHPREDLHAAHIWGVSDDARARAHTSEFLDTLLRRQDQRALRELLRLVLDDVSNEERVRRSAGLVPYPAPISRDEALLRLVKDRDAVVSALASLHLAAMHGRSARVTIGRAPLENARV
jgi:AAA family ATP:ADP antiporter